MLKVPFDAQKIPALSAEYELMVTEKDLLRAADVSCGSMWIASRCLRVCLPRERPK
jgi:hypothetical protein